MSTSLTRNIAHRSDHERFILQRINRRVRDWDRIVSKKFEQWRQTEENVLAYIPETETDRKRKQAREGGLPQYTTIQIPYSYAVLMSAHTYITSVFFGRNPVFQYSGRHGESQQKVQAMEALVDYQFLNGYILPQLYTWIYDALKYGFGVQGLYWCEDWNAVTEIQEMQETDIFGTPTGRKSKQQTTSYLRSYAGNKTFPVQPQDFIWDARYPAREFQRGEYCGRRFKLGWNEVIRRQKLGYYMNVGKIGHTSKDYYGSDKGTEQLDRPEVLANNKDGTGDIFFLDDQNNKARHPSIVGCYELVIEIIPDEWRLGSSDFPEKWVFTCLDDFSLLIGAQPLGAYHCNYPYAVIPMEPEGYGLTTRGLPEILQPVQNTLDWLLNSHFFNVRAALNNKFVVDPSRVVMKDVLDPLPGGVIRMKPVAYGTDARLAINQMQVADVTRTNMADMMSVMGIGERAGGVNDQIMGMLNTGGRKTATEVRTSTSFGINRLKTMAEFASACGMDPLSRMMVQNSQQFYDMELQFKIAGDLLQNAGQSFMMVTPDMITGFYDYVPVDGTYPIDRFAQVTLWKELFQAILSVPQIGFQYDLGGIFTWVAQLAGLKNITQFKLQVTPDQVLAAQAAAGNSIPLSGPNAGGQSGSNTKPGPNKGNSSTLLGIPQLQGALQ